MAEIIIDSENAGRRLDKVLAGYLRAADSGFLQKMLRKKNIVVNGKKAAGAYRVAEHDVITLFFAEETLSKFRGTREDALYREAYETLRGDDGSSPDILYEDDALLIISKPAGVLSQGDRTGSFSLNDWARGYLLARGTDTYPDPLTGFWPSVANRLDRNTSGLIVCAKKQAAARAFSALQKARKTEKTYHAIVFGKASGTGVVYDTVRKDRAKNLVAVSLRNPSDGETLSWQLLHRDDALDASLLRVRLFDGKPHQIRAQLAERGYPVAGDYKYGNRARNDAWKQRFGIRSQLLHSRSLTFPGITDGVLADVSEKTFFAPLPPQFESVMLALYAHRHVTYLMQCADGSLYCGYTNDPEKRVLQHNTGQGAKYTRGRGPVHPVFVRAFETKEEAMKEEWRIKQLSRAEKLALIR